MTTDVDLWIYKSFGYTPFSSPSSIDIKQIHLGRVGNLRERVMVRGKVDFVHDLGTYLLLEQQNVKLVVDLSDLALARQEIEKSDPQYLEIIGGVERSFKGLPFLKAYAFKSIAKNEFE